ncbi:13671_t:CDS:2 [Dentiscutata erythropus]|uniref:13671_t:CDS:1 n=1 Tax=Dentiscutata erythropus TaxID=1348616 RepID=A0A9N9G325_9GLOM|nr:13671_t:CDS:2 [Dentiscutata erythropus]
MEQLSFTSIKEKLEIKGDRKLILDIIADELTCPITRQITGDFLILTCGHSIIKQAGYFDKSSEERQMSLNQIYTAAKAEQQEDYEAVILWLTQVIQKVIQFDVEEHSHLINLKCIRKLTMI